MKILAVLLSLSVPLSAQPLAVSSAAPAEAPLEVLEVSTITVTAPRPRGAQEERVLKIARGTGLGMAAGGAGLMSYVLILDLVGPFGWAASLLFLGGMTAYLSHRRLQGYEDFPPSSPQGAGAADKRAKAASK